MESVPEKKDFISRNRRSPGQTSTQAENTDITTQGRDQKLRNRMVGDQPMWSQRRNCERLPLYVDFFEIGWSGWIISPSGYNAYYCQGECPFPLGQMHRPSNHATVQSIVNAIGPKLESGAKIPQPCCVPDKLYSISLLYFDDSGDVILKQYDDMVAASCGCHWNGILHYSFSRYLRSNTLLMYENPTVLYCNSDKLYLFLYIVDTIFWY